MGAVAAGELAPRTPGRAGPGAALFWIPLLAADLALLVFLRHAPWLLLGLIAATLFLLLLRRPAVALAVSVSGAPLLEPLYELTRSERPSFLLALALAALPVAATVWNALWEPRRFARIPLGPAAGVWLCAAGLGLVLLLGRGWTSAPVYGGGKTQLYWTVNMVQITAALLLLGRASRGGEPAALVRFLRAVLWLQAGIALAGVWNLFAHYFPFRDRLATLGLNPIWLARHAGLGLLVAIGLAGTRALRRRWLWALAPLFGAVFLLARSRGPAAALAGALLLWIATAPAGAGTRGRKLGRALLVLILMSVPFWVRFETGGGGLPDISNPIRLRLLAFAREALAGISALGLGPGGFGELVGFPDQRWYPHNIILEVLLEAGLVGLALLGGLLAGVAAAWRRWGRAIDAGGATRIEPRLRRLLGAIFLYVLLNAQFSGDLPVNEWIWAFAGAIVVVAPTARERVARLGGSGAGARGGGAVEGPGGGPGRGSDDRPR